MSITVYPGKTLGHHMPRPSKEVSCRGCRVWFDGMLGECPECGWERPKFNKWLRTAKLNGQLYEQAAQNDEHARMVREAYKETPPR